MPHHTDVRPHRDLHMRAMPRCPKITQHAQFAASVDAAERETRGPQGHDPRVKDVSNSEHDNHLPDAIPGYFGNVGYHERPHDDEGTTDGIWRNVACTHFDAVAERHR